MPIQVPSSNGCLFCEYLAHRGRCVIVVETDRAAAFVNPTQYERGAMLIVPLEHRETILDLSDDEVAAIYRLARRLALACVTGLGAVAVNIFQNNGVKANQTVPHCHVHVVPRYAGSDPTVNFRGRDYGETPLAMQRAVAGEIRRGLAVTA